MIVPVPLTATLCGLVAVLSLIDSVPLLAPIALGVNPMAIVQLARCASPLGGQVVAPVAANSEPLEVTPPTNNKFVPMFLTVMFLMSVSPTGELPIASVVGTEIEVVGVAVAVGVAVSVAVAVAVDVSVAVEVAVAVAVTVAVAVAVDVAVAVGVAVSVAVAVGVAVFVAVAVAVEVAVAVAVAVGVAVAVAVEVDVAVDVAVSVGVAVAVDVAV